MIDIEKKLDKVHINLWAFYHLILLSKKTYIAILLNNRTQKS